VLSDLTVAPQRALILSENASQQADDAPCYGFPAASVPLVVGGGLGRIQTLLGEAW